MKKETLPRWLSPTVAVFVLALVASLAIHLPVYQVLGILKKWWEEEEAAAARALHPMEIEIVGQTMPTEVAAVQPAIDPTLAPQTEPVAAVPVAAAPVPQAEPEREPEPEEEQERVVQQPPPPSHDQRQAITQRSRDPNVEPPPEARFVARENQRVEEETAARIRSYTEDSPDPTPGATQESSSSRDPGNAREQETADQRDREGEDARQAREPAVRRASEGEAAPTPPAPIPPPEPVARPGTPSREAPGERGGAVAAGGGGERRESRVVEDSTGRWSVAEVPVEGVGPGAGGGTARPAAGLAREGMGNSSGRPGTGRRGTRGPGAREGRPFRVTWGVFEETYGERQLEEEREQYAEERRSRIRGSNDRQRQWEQFRSAIENFAPNVRPGNQTALNAAASPFAEYLAEVHRRIHRQFADRFLGGLPAGGTSPFADRTLMTKLEIILNRDGTVHRIGVVQTSGFLPYDYGAFAAVIRGQPYPEPPGQILSGDGRVYFHWGFYRNERQCGTFNAEPYILPNPPGSAPMRPGPLRDRPDYGGVIPRGARPAGDGSTLPQRGHDDAGDGHDHPSDSPRDDSAPPPRPRPQPEEDDDHEGDGPAEGGVVG